VHCFYIGVQEKAIQTRRCGVDPGEALDKIGRGRVLVVGDVMLDRYLWGDAQRISPEAPVPVVRVREKTEVLGGAGNAASNLAGLTCPAILIGVRGDDSAGERLAAILENNGIEPGLILDPARPTITKTRVVAQGQQLIRLDEERPESLSPQIASGLLTMVEKFLPSCQGMLLSDYGKGTFQTPGVAKSLIKLARKLGIPVMVDPKGQDWDRYEHAACVTPNTAELEAVAGSSALGGESRLAETAKSIAHRYKLEWLLVTRGPLGVCLVGQDEDPLFIAGVAREVYDVSGAGDTVVATLAAGVAAGLPFPIAARLANLAAGIVVGKVGTQPISLAELRTAILMMDADGSPTGPTKVCTLDAARMLVQAWRASGEKIVFTNGCFDLLHPGHIQLLHQARAVGDHLVVGVNSDLSVQGLKGANRPILSERDRASLLGALACVDVVVVFEEETPLTLIDALRPDVLVKGADYKLEDVVGRDVVESYGGKVVLVPILEGYSTSGIVNKLSTNDVGS
jgi:D-beta-D-heptose 7-phosphate kinase/D-beta-D-heptose 1-phosphate adenosyltransferase